MLKRCTRPKESEMFRFQPQEVDEADFAGGGLGQLHDLAIRSQSRGNKATWQGEVRG